MNCLFSLLWAGSQGLRLHALPPRRLQDPILLPSAVSQRQLYWTNLYLYDELALSKRVWLLHCLALKANRVSRS